MADLTYKCPGCGGYLAFDPESQAWVCPYCDSHFQQSELKADQQPEPQESGAQVVYHCPGCGSEIMTDETTVATQCYYCHNPVVLKGKLTDELRPDGVLPFTIDKQKAVDTFMAWVKSKRYVPRDFFSRAQAESMSGVYYPHFVTECEVEGAIDGEGRNVSVTSTPNYIVTNTRHFHVRREADMQFRGIMRPALGSLNRKLTDGIHPFPLENEKPFSGAYLSGFLAERRDVDPESIRGDVAAEVERYVEPLLADNLHYDSHTVRSEARLKKLRTRYLLFPTWVLTYPNKHDVQNPYYYVMNGCTGKVCGKLPLDRKKLYLRALMLAAGVFACACLAFYFFV